MIVRDWIKTDFNYFSWQKLGENFKNRLARRKLPQAWKIWVLEITFHDVRVRERKYKLPDGTEREKQEEPKY